MALRKKQKAFVEYYLQSWNATDAAKKAGYSEKTAHVIGHENLRKPNIKSEIDKRIEELTLDANEVLSSLGKMARGFNLADYIKFIETFMVDDDNIKIPTGVLLSFDLDRLNNDGYGDLIKRIKQTANGIDIEFYDRQSSLVHIGKHLGLFNEGSVDINLNIFNKEEWHEKRQARLQDIEEVTEPPEEYVQ